MSIICGVEIAQKSRFPVDRYMRRPSLVGSAPARAEQSTCVVARELADIPVIDALRNVAEIEEPVIGAIAVDVINGPLRPSSVCVQPCEPVREEIGPVEDRKSTRLNSSHQKI